MVKNSELKISPIDLEQRRRLDVKPGSTVKVWQRVPEKDGKYRLQAFEGLVIACRHGKEAGATFTVRRVASGVGMEKIFPLYSPMIDRIEILREVKVRRAKLYYIRDKAAKEIRRRMRRIVTGKRQEEADELVEQVIAGIEPESSENLEEINSTETEIIETTEDDKE